MAGNIYSIICNKKSEQLSEKNKSRPVKRKLFSNIFSMFSNIKPEQVDDGYSTFVNDSFCTDNIDTYKFEKDEDCCKVNNVCKPDDLCTTEKYSKKLLKNDYIVEKDILINDFDNLTIINNIRKKDNNGGTLKHERLPLILPPQPPLSIDFTKSLIADSKKKVLTMKKKNNDENHILKYKCLPSLLNTNEYDVENKKCKVCCVSLEDLTNNDANYNPCTKCKELKSNVDTSCTDVKLNNTDDCKYDNEGLPLLNKDDYEKVLDQCEYENKKVLDQCENENKMYINDVCTCYENANTCTCSFSNLKYEELPLLNKDDAGKTLDQSEYKNKKSNTGICTCYEKANTFTCNFSNLKYEGLPLSPNKYGSEKILKHESLPLFPNNRDESEKILLQKKESEKILLQKHDCENEKSNNVCLDKKNDKEKDEKYIDVYDDQQYRPTYYKEGLKKNIELGLINDGLIACGEIINDYNYVNCQADPSSVESSSSLLDDEYTNVEFMSLKLKKRNNVVDSLKKSIKNKEEKICYEKNISSEEFKKGITKYTNLNDKSIYFGLDKDKIFDKNEQSELFDELSKYNTNKLTCEIDTEDFNNMVESMGIIYKDKKITEHLKGYKKHYYTKDNIILYELDATLNESTRKKISHDLYKYGYLKS